MKMSRRNNIWDKDDDSADWYRETHNRRLRHKPIFKDGKEATIVDFLAAWFRTSRFSYFQFEGEARVSLRVMILQKGHGWQAADDEAHRLIQAALHLIGAQRPRKEEASDEWTMEEWCSFCRGPLDDEAIARRDRYCCSQCAKLALTRRAWGRGGYSSDYFGAVAYRQIRREQLPERTCKNCGNRFRPNTTTITESQGRQYCSVACWGEARRTLPDVECQNPGCRNVFRPDSAGRKYCSHQCSVEARAIILPLRDCAYCGVPFQPANESALYCSAEHGRKMKDRRRREARQAAKVERPCEFCRKPFLPRKRDAVYCSTNCQKKAAYYRQKAATTDPKTPIGKLFSKAA